MPKVYNKRTDQIPEGAVYVGRPTKWGNPFQMKGEEDRDTVVDQYHMHFMMGQLRAKPKDLHELKGKDLVCWCAPLRCHADVLLEIANVPSNDEK